jgi:PPOX class probable F420-dependent enzyme
LEPPGAGGLLCSLRGFADKEAQKAHEEEEAQEDAEGDPLATAGGPVVEHGGSPMGTNQRGRIRMSDEEVDAFLEEERTATLCSMHPDGSIHAVAMWYGFVDGRLAFETKGKSQKIQNLRRDPRLTVLVEAGERYEELRGVELVGRARIVEDEDALWKLGVSVWERYMGPYDESQREALAVMLRNRVVVTIDVDRTVTWDHRKL